MITRPDGTMVARTPEELTELLQIASSGKASNKNVDLNDPLVLAGLATMIPGLENQLASSIPVGRMPTADAPKFMAQTANYKIDPRGNVVGDLMLDAAAGYGDLTGQLKTGLDKPIRQAKVGIGKAVGPAGRRMAGGAVSALASVPGMAKAGQILGVAAPALGALGGGLAVGDVILGDDSVGNKVMDTVAMGIGGTLGAVGGPLGIATGVGLGKMVSDGTQWLFGDKKTPEQRKMELALAQLRGGVI